LHFGSAATFCGTPALPQTDRFFLTDTLPL
jgi:hypothetical protein